MTKFISVPAVALALAGLASLPSHAQTPPMAGTVKRVQGTAVASAAPGSERAIGVGDSVFAGERVLTRDGGAVGITLLDGTQLAVGPNSAVAVRNFQFDSTTRQGSLLVDITRGAMRMVSGLLAQANPQSVSITTPSTTIGVRGTDFLVDVGDAPAQQ